ncbi:glycoside hydrolase family 20 zincin-like fold domain-containing protein [Asanoa sp. NPDC050611]|uniref:glycoside hydrolase family 20 zincin-like fold domain-containing protein n=1 Tax=Asanoa sp. NPDC050611 TaxID=3157098 RepID=UPI0033DA102F
MKGPKRRTTAVALVLLLAAGAAVAYGVDGALGLSHVAADVPDERSTGTSRPRPVQPAPDIATIAVPDDRTLSRAAEVVADALAQRGRPRPTVTHGEERAQLTARITTLPGNTEPERYRLSAGPDGISIEGASTAGVANGLYALADRIRSGAAIPASEVSAPRLGLRLTDAGSVGREPDPAAFRAGTDYSLNTDIVGEALLPQAPWVDAAAALRIAEQFRQFVDHSLSQGYNGIVIPGFLEYVTFQNLGVYDADHIGQTQALVDAFAPIFAYAADSGMKVFFLTDMLALSPQLERYLRRTTGGLDTADPDLWATYQQGLEELFARMPYASGLMIRVGEGGAVYKQQGWDYESRLAVTTPAAVRAMLSALLTTAGKGGRDIIFRSWTVGVGAVGDLHTNPASYDEVLGGIADPHLIVSTKYTAGDFYSHLPLNPTLATGGQRRIVEFQSRREFEGFGALPNDLTALHQQALRAFLSQNPHVEGIWTWTQDGGPLRAGPMSLYLREGFWQLYDLNTYAAARLAWRPETPADEITRDWINQTFSTDANTANRIAEMFGRSRAAINTGLYIGPYADKSVKALGLEPPPMMWIFEWDIVTGDSAAIDSIYAVSKDRLDEAIADGQRATTLATEMRDLVAATDPTTWHDPAGKQRLTDALDYQVDLFATLAAYRATVLRHAQWLDTGSETAQDQWRQARAEYRKARTRHLQRYAGRLDLPAYNFTAADLGVDRADRDPAMAWLARALLAGILLVFLLGATSRFPTCRALWLGATRPWRASTTRANTYALIAIPAIALVASRLAYTWFASPAHVGLVLSAWLLFALAVRLLTRQPPWAVIGGVALLRSALVLAVLAVRGPGHYWLGFWTAPTARALYITVAFAAFGWLFVATGMAYGTRRTIIAAGTTLAILAAAVAAIGLEDALTTWNDQLALLPWGLSRILGITVYLGIPTNLPAIAAAAGAVAAIAAALRRRRPTTPGRIEA